MKPPAGRDKVILLGILWTAVMLGVALGVAFPLYLRLTGFNATYEERRHKLRALEERVEEFSAIKSEHERVSLKLPLIHASFLSEKDAVSFIETLETLSRENTLYKEIRLASARESATEAGAFGSLPFQMTVVGSFRNVFRFLAQLENLSYYVDVEKVGITNITSKTIYGSGARGALSEKFTAAPGDIAASLVFRVHTVP